MKSYSHVLTTAAVAVVLVSFATLVGVSVTMASPASGVTPTLLARGAYADFKVKSIPGSPVDFQVKAKSAVDVVVRNHDYAIGSHTGWHSHPGPASRSAAGLGMTTALSMSMPNHVSSPSQIGLVSIQIGVPGTKASGSTTSCAPAPAASAVSSSTRSIVASRFIRT